LRSTVPLSALLLALAAAPSTARAAAGAEPSAEELARGEAVMQSFCLSCHGKDGKNPLRPRLDPDGWGDPDKAYANIGRLQQIQPKMDQPFTRSDEDRRALAGYLARLARENRRSPWEVALPYAAMAAGVAVAGGFFAWALRRGRA